MSPAAWPLSAAATAILRNPRTDANEVLKLALKELVVRRVWRLEREPARRRWGKDTLCFAPGTTQAPGLVPLGLADEELRSAIDAEGPEVRAAVKHLVLRAVPVRARDLVREELAARGLARIERRKALGLFPRQVVVLSPDGERWAQAVAERCAEAERAVSEHAPDAHADVLALGALVLFVSPPVLSELDGVVRRQPADSGGGAPGGTPPDSDGEGLDLDLGALDDFSLDDLDVFDALDSGFDSAFDSGSSDGGGGGGGGGDGGGGGS